MGASDGAHVVRTNEFTTRYNERRGAGGRPRRHTRLPGSGADSNTLVDDARVAETRRQHSQQYNRAQAAGSPSP
eukprot:1319612-Prymnesium_polylepis.1